MPGRGPVIPLLGAVAALAAAVAVASAQEPRPAATPAAVLGAEPLPSAILAGSCEAPGDVAFELGDVGEAAAGGATPPAGAEGVLAVGLTQLEASLEDVLAAEHAVVVLVGGDVAACGAVAGDPGQAGVYGGQAFARLEERDGSGLRGQAILTEVGPGSTNVTVMLARADSAALATPGATPGP